MTKLTKVQDKRFDKIFSQDLLWKMDKVFSGSLNLKILLRHNLVQELARQKKEMAPYDIRKYKGWDKDAIYADVTEVVKQLEKVGE